jgi:hypothetical protein
MVSVNVPPYVPPRTRLLQLRPNFCVFFALSLLMFSFLQDSLLCFSKQCSFVFFNKHFFDHFLGRCKGQFSQRIFISHVTTSNSNF